MNRRQGRSGSERGFWKGKKSGGREEVGKEGRKGIGR